MSENFSTLQEDDDFPVDSLAGLDASEEDSREHDSQDTTAICESSENTYWQISRTPLTSLIFSLPLILMYEGGVIILGYGSPRNGADVWLRQFLDQIGFGAYFLLPFLTIVGLLAWHHIAHDTWHFRAGILLGMAAESLLWAFLLITIANLHETFWTVAVDNAPLVNLLSRFVGYCGAGLYEEVLFRLILLPTLIWLLRRCGVTPISAGVCAVCTTSVLFSAAHYVGPLGEPFYLYSFTFRTLAGLFFSTLFLTRGFGITAGSHATYDLLVGLS
jgi:hypothetical protein